MWKIALTLAVVLSFAALAFPGDGMAQAGSYPDRPIRFVAPYGPGGTVDPTARVLAGPVGEILGQPVIVENKPGAAGSIGTEYVIRQPADGYTVLIHTNLVASEPWLKPSLPYKFLKDMTPVMAINETPFVLLVNPSLPAKTVKEFVDHAKAQPRASSTTAPRASARRATSVASSSSWRPASRWSSFPTSTAGRRCAGCWATRSRSRSTPSPAPSA